MVCASGVASVAMAWLGLVMTDFGWLAKLRSQVAGANGDLKRSDYDLNHDLRLI